MGDVVFGTMYLAHRGSVERCWSRAAEAELATTNTAPPSAEAEHLPAPASSLQPGARGQVVAGGGAGRGGAQHSQHSTLLISAFAFRSSSGCPEPGVQAPGSRPALLGTNFHQLGRGATAGVFPLA